MGFPCFDNIDQVVLLGSKFIKLFQSGIPAGIGDIIIAKFTDLIKIEVKRIHTDELFVLPLIDSYCHTQYQPGRGIGKIVPFPMEGNIISKFIKITLVPEINHEIEKVN